MGNHRWTRIYTDELAERCFSPPQINQCPSVFIRGSKTLERVLLRLTKKEL